MIPASIQQTPLGAACGNHKAPTAKREEIIVAKMIRSPRSLCRGMVTAHQHPAADNDTDEGRADCAK
jgi:hypothetical protein